MKDDDDAQPSATEELLVAAKEALAWIERHTSGLVIDEKDALRFAISRAEERRSSARTSTSTH